MAAKDLCRREGKAGEQNAQDNKCRAVSPHMPPPSRFPTNAAESIPTIEGPDKAPKKVGEGCLDMKCVPESFGQGTRPENRLQWPQLSSRATGLPPIPPKEQSTKPKDNKYGTCAGQGRGQTKRKGSATQEFRSQGYQIDAQPFLVSKCQGMFTLEHLEGVNSVPTFIELQSGLSSCNRYRRKNRATTANAKRIRKDVSSTG